MRTWRPSPNANCGCLPGVRVAICLRSLVVREARATLAGAGCAAQPPAETPIRGFFLPATGPIPDCQGRLKAAS